MYCKIMINFCSILGIMQICDESWSSWMYKVGFTVSGSLQNFFIEGGRIFKWKSIYLVL